MCLFLYTPSGMLFHSVLQANIYATCYRLNGVFVPNSFIVMYVIFVCYGVHIFMRLRIFLLPRKHPSTDCFVHDKMPLNMPLKTTLPG